MKINNQKGFIIPLVIAIIAVLAVGGGVYVYENKKVEAPKTDVNIESNVGTTTAKETTNTSDATKDWKLALSEKKDRFTFKCPNDWKRSDSLGYGGKVSYTGCSQIYSPIAFDDGVSIIFGFVDGEAVTYEWAGEKTSDFILNNVKGESNAKAFSLNNFNGWVSMKNEKHAVALVGRITVPGGYGRDGYIEVIAEAQGGRQSDSQYKAIIDQIISTFKLTKTISTQPSITVLSPNGGEVIPYGNIAMAGDLNFTWTTSQKNTYLPTKNIRAYVIDETGKIVRDDPLLVSLLKINNTGDGIFGTSFAGELNLKTNIKYKIKVCDYIGSIEYCDSSDSYFIIK